MPGEDKSAEALAKLRQREIRNDQNHLWQPPHRLQPAELAFYIRMASELIVRIGGSGLYLLPG